jgi:hypothetical protein
MNCPVAVCLQCIALKYNPDIDLNNVKKPVCPELIAPKKYERYLTRF